MFWAKRTTYQLYSQNCTMCALLWISNQTTDFKNQTILWPKIRPKLNHSLSKYQNKTRPLCDQKLDLNQTKYLTNRTNNDPVPTNIFKLPYGYHIETNTWYTCDKDFFILNTTSVFTFGINVSTFYQQVYTEILIFSTCIGIREKKPTLKGTHIQYHTQARLSLCI